MPDRLLFMMSRVQHRLSAHIKRALKREGLRLSPGQIGVLMVLDRDGRSSMGHLSQVLDVDNAAATRLVDKLEGLGFVARGTNPSDRRQVLISLTPEGRRASQGVKAIVQDANHRITESLSPDDLAAFGRVGEAIIQTFS
jgi:DNA-binding MarR family transcriptional regulator